MSETKPLKPKTPLSSESKDFRIPTAGRRRPTHAQPAAKSASSDRQRGPQRRFRSRMKDDSLEFSEKVVDISRVTTVVKGGRRFSFSAVVVVGDKKGSVGWGHGKANEVPDAIKKAIKDARKRQVKVPIIDKRTVPHVQSAKFLASRVMVKPAPRGKGIVASGAVRAVVELAGYKDIYTKSLGSRSKTNAIKATIKALSELRTVEQIAEMRGLNVSHFKHKKQGGEKHATAHTPT